jgi:hypothetical protein
MRKTVRRKTFRRNNSNKRGTRKHYTLLNKAGAIDETGNRTDTISMVATLRSFLETRPGPDLQPFILEPYAATRISRAYTKSRSSYARSLLPFLKYLKSFFAYINMPISNPPVLAQIRSKLLRSIPDGMRVERFLAIPGIGDNITQLQEKLNEPHPSDKRSIEFQELYNLVNSLKITIEIELARHITIPPFRP